MFERFTTDARAVVDLAAQDDDPVDGVTLLLALAWLDAGPDACSAAAVLHAAGLDRARLTAAATTVERPGHPRRPAGDAPGTPSPRAAGKTPASTPGDLDADALAALGIDLDAVRAQAEQTFGPGALDAPTPSEGRRRPRRSRLTPDAKKVLELAVREAVRRHDGEIRSTHLLLGVLRDPASPAARTLVAAGADLEALRAAAEASGARAA